ncbi:hypothetical protein ACFPH6_15370 [Streptomyces xiangluensis]|uniref:Uncharacterized protein n=1 Tax=Streptomyces xiangluensis TaxID=2665720 RepID=A0ABV8YMU0_9ACTN
MAATRRVVDGLGEGGTVTDDGCLGLVRHSYGVAVAVDDLVSRSGG